MVLFRTHSLCATIHDEMSWTTHRATPEISLLPAARCFAAATPPRGGRNSVPVAGLRGFFAFLELHGQVMSSLVVGCFAFLWSFSLFKSSRGFVGLLRWMQRHGKSAKCKCLSVDSVEGLHGNVFFPPKIFANSDF